MATVVPLLLVQAFGFVALIVQTEGHADLLAGDPTRSARDLYLLGTRLLVRGAVTGAP